jgi:glycerol-3-phosphate responsive antiterminator
MIRSMNDIEFTKSANSVQVHITVVDINGLNMIEKVEELQNSPKIVLVHDDLFNMILKKDHDLLPYVGKGASKIFFTDRDDALVFKIKWGDVKVIANAVVSVLWK